MRQPRYRHSWKKPWAFESLWHMRNIITEREVYNKIKVLERHSAFKKPYRAVDHPRGELYYSPPGFPVKDPNVPEIPIIPPGNVPNCDLACNGGILDCKNGGCDIITCICPVYPIVGVILEDPTGSAWLTGGSSEHDMLKVCIPMLDEDKTLPEYPVIVVLVTDYFFRQTVVEHPLVNCQVCCDPFTLTGDNTVNPAGDWEGTIDPPCPGATCTVQSNSGCDISCSVNGSGSKVTVSPGATDCGAFEVTVTKGVEDCATVSATKVVRINDTGQGGAWVPYCNYNTSNCPTAGCPVEDAYSDEWKVTLKCGNLGADCDSRDWDRTCQGDQVTGHNCDACDGINQTTMYRWECAAC